MLDGAELVAFVATSDADRSCRFYRRTLGLPLLERTDYACVYRAGNATLRVTTAPAVTPAPYTVLGWQVPDITAASAWLGERGISPLRYEGIDQDEDGVWAAPSGARVLWFSDPDHNVLSLTQL